RIRAAARGRRRSDRGCSGSHILRKGCGRSRSKNGGELGNGRFICTDAEDGPRSDQDADEEHVSQWHRLPVRAEQLGRLIDLIADGTISGRIAKDVFDEMMRASGYPDPMQIVEASGLRQVTDTGAIEAAVDAALAAHPAQVAQYHANPKVLGFFVGQVMKATGGKANPALVNQLLKKKLGG